MTDRPMPPSAELATVPQTRDIVSFRIALDSTGRVAAMKILTEGGQSEVMLLAAPVALHLRDRMRESLRARPGLAQLPTDNAFFRRQPSHDAADFSLESRHVAAPIGAHLETAGETCVIAFPLDREGRHTAYRMRALYAGYFMHAIAEAEESAGFGAASASGASESAQGTHGPLN